MDGAWWKRYAATPIVLSFLFRLIIKKSVGGCTLLLFFGNGTFSFVFLRLYVYRIINDKYGFVWCNWCA